MARYILDMKYNGAGGDLITMCLVRDDNMVFHMGFQESTTVPLDDWVAKNIVPVIMSCPVKPSWANRIQVQLFLRELLAKDENIVIVTDWPTDVIYFSKLLMVDPTTLIASQKELPRITFQIERVDAYPTTIPIAIQHNCFWDAMALREKIDYPNGRPTTEINSV